MKIDIAVVQMFPELYDKKHNLNKMSSFVKKFSPRKRSVT